MSLPLPPVLVVDDEKNMRLSLKTVLSAERYGVPAVESAEEALALRIGANQGEGTTHGGHPSQASGRTKSSRSLC